MLQSKHAWLIIFSSIFSLCIFTLIVMIISKGSAWTVVWDYIGHDSSGENNRKRRLNRMIIINKLKTKHEELINIIRHIFRSMDKIT